MATSEPPPSDDITFRFMRGGEERAVCNLILRAFDLSIAPLYTKKGRLNFRKYADPGVMTARVRSGHFILVAAAGDRAVGMVEMRGHRHVSLLFVDAQYQGRGIGRRLLDMAVETACQADQNLREVTVNSSPNARRAYERMGFAATGSQQEISGVRSVPMVKVLKT